LKLEMKRNDNMDCPSLPVRERGLKPVSTVNILMRSMSLPVRERGLKQESKFKDGGLLVSLPVRERGLKQAASNIIVGGTTVAPRAGAWIETECP